MESSLSHTTFLLGLFFVSMNIGFVLSEFSTYPSIYWHPWNPIFACDLPTITVRIGDTINFLCPSDEFKFYMPPSIDANKMIYENLHFLGKDENKFKSCDAQGAKQLLLCDSDTAKYSTITFRDVPTSVNALKFQRNETYYFIGTGFRTLEHVNNVVNGSCREAGGKDQFRLRLRVEVCPDDKCDVCTTEACYYENCGSTCSKWELQNIINLDEKCLRIMTRKCNYPFMKKKQRTEYKKEEMNLAECRATHPDKAGSADGDRPVCADLVTYKILSYITTSLLLFLLILIILTKVQLIKNVRDCFTRDVESCEMNGFEIVEANNKFNPGSGTNNIAYKHSLLGKSDQKKIKAKKKDRTNGVI